MPTEGIRLGIFGPALASDPRIAARLAREAGFAGLQYDAVSANLDLPRLSPSGRREFLRMLSSQDRQLIGLRADAGPKGLGPGADVDRVIDQLDGAMETAAAMGAPLLCVELGPLPPAPVIEKNKSALTTLQAGLIIIPEPAQLPEEFKQEPAPPPDPAFVSQLNSALSELGDRADRYSTIVAFRSDLASSASLARALREASCPWFGVDLDPVSALGDDWDLDELFSRLGPEVRHVRARDAVRGPDRRTKPAVVGQGNVEWESLLANLEQVGYRGWLTLDPSDLTDRAGAGRAGLKYLQSFVR